MGTMLVKRPLTVASAPEGSWGDVRVWQNYVRGPEGHLRGLGGDRRVPRC